jgi:hypothetical protein
MAEPFETRLDGTTLFETGEEIRLYLEHVISMK